MEQSRQTDIIRLGGHLDTASTPLIAAAIDALADHPAVLVDLSAIAFADAGVAGLLTRAYRDRGERGLWFAAVAAPDQFLEVLDILGEAKELGAYLSVDDGLSEAAGVARRHHPPSPIDARIHDLCLQASRTPTDEPRRRHLHAQAVETGLPIARSLARRFRHRGEPMDDLVQVASLALVKAIAGYDPARGSGFAAYAVPTILGELRRHFRDHTWGVHVPRPLQELRGQIHSTRQDLTQALMREPTTHDIADYLGVSDNDIREALATHSAYRPASLDAPLTTDYGTITIGDTLATVDSHEDLIDSLMALQPLLARLPESDRHLLDLRFVKQQTQAAIAGQLGVSQMQISRRLTDIIGRLRMAMVGDGIDPPALPIGWPVTGKSSQ